MKTMANFRMPNNKITIKLRHHISFLSEIVKLSLIKIIIVDNGLVEGARIVLSLRKEQFYDVLNDLWEQF